MRVLSSRALRTCVPQHVVYTSSKRASCLACNARSSNSPWKIELAELNEAIRKSCDDEEVWDSANEVVEVVDESESLNLIADQERVFLVGVEVKSERREGDTFTVDESLSELASLSRTAGLAVVGSATQALSNPNPSTYLGSGKLASVAAQVHDLAVDTVIIDDEISPGQQRNLEKALGKGVRVADRTALILDIFAQRARTKEGKLQVDLAAAAYQLPRLQRMWTHLDRQSGGGQVKGMGEKQKEVDKRLLRDKMAVLRKEIEGVRAHRSSQRNRRRIARMPSVALIGYTNAGKSTLLNSLTAAGVLAENTLFATLDPTVRRIVLPTGKLALLSDTVGFIQKLPTQLVDSFRATLEEIKEADVLVHVVDVSHPQASKQAEAVFRILEELKVSDELPMVTAWNKVDAHANPDVVRRVANTRPDTVAVSGSSGFCLAFSSLKEIVFAGEGVEDLIVTVEAALEEAMVQFEALVPYSEGHIINQVREEGVIRLEKYTEDGVQLAGSADLATIAVIQPYITEFTPRERVFEWRQEQALATEE